MKRWLLFLSAVVILVMLSFMVPSTSSALPMGNTVEYQYLFPTINNNYPFADNGNYLVGPGIEVANIVDDVGTMDIFVTPPPYPLWMIYVVFNRSGTFSQGLFNGFRITDIFGTIPDFRMVMNNTYTNMAGFDQSRITFDADHIWVNWQGLSFDWGTIVVLEVNPDPLPEPSTLLLLGSGILGLAYARKRFKA